MISNDQLPIFWGKSSFIIFYLLNYVKKESVSAVKLENLSCLKSSVNLWFSKNVHEILWKIKKGRQLECDKKKKDTEAIFSSQPCIKSFQCNHFVSCFRHMYLDQFLMTCKCVSMCVVRSEEVVSQVCGSIVISTQMKLFSFSQPSLSDLNAAQREDWWTYLTSSRKEYTAPAHVQQNCESFCGTLLN